MPNPKASAMLACVKESTSAVSSLTSCFVTIGTTAYAVQCTVLPHITASVFINDDAGIWAGAHLKRIASRSEIRVMGREVVVAVTNGRLDSCTWVRILCQVDG